MHNLNTQEKHISFVFWEKGAFYITSMLEVIDSLEIKYAILPLIPELDPILTHTKQDHLDKS